MKKLLVTLGVCFLILKLVSCGNQNTKNENLDEKTENTSSDEDEDANNLIGIWGMRYGSEKYEIIKIEKSGKLFLICFGETDSNPKDFYSYPTYSYRLNDQVLYPVDENTEKTSISLISNEKILYDGDKYEKIDDRMMDNWREVQDSLANLDFKL